jgi:predicted glycogen debranching enzyme
MARPQFIRFGREICGDLQQAERREWWLANGRGSYAAGTVAGSLTRRYHGLLIAPLDPPLGRALVFVKADAWLDIGGDCWPLHSNRWPDDTVDPQGHRHIESFALAGRMPQWRFAFGDVRLELRIWMEPGADTVCLAYRPETPDGDTRALRLRIKLLVNSRDHHGDTESSLLDPVVESAGADGLLVRNRAGSGLPPYVLRFQARGGSFEPEHHWYENFDLPRERERGLSHRDAHLCVGECRLLLQHGRWSGLIASVGDPASADLEVSMQRFIAHDEGLLAQAHQAVPPLDDAPEWIDQLVLAADSFLFVRELGGGTDGESVIAGYPWFGDWGRDTMIALPGLTLATGRHDSARRILDTFAGFVDRGMLPNAFPGNGKTADYNTVDAALWYIEAWRSYIEVSDDQAALRQVFPILEDIIRWQCAGTRHGIMLDESDGLLRAGESGVQLTWMDAKIGEWVVTPRIGKPVEINALWFNALNAMAGFAGRLGGSPLPYQALADAARNGFQRFVDVTTGALLDVLDGPSGNEHAVRPNQILAVSLPFSPLTAETQRAVVAVCGQHLLISCGMRSLHPDSADYQPFYRGGVRERDGAYHQGTAWAWLLGHYVLAHYRAFGDREAALGLLVPIRDHLFDAGLGTVSEIFEGEPPHPPCGAPAQAWSVACVLEAWWRINTTASP